MRSVKHQMDSLTRSIKQELFVDVANTFAVLDGASVLGLLNQLDKYKPEFICLYRGELKPDLAEAAPYLVRLQPENDFTDWLLTKGWGRHWGIFAIADADLQGMRQHFRRLLTVYDEKGKPLLFRFYDPRVMRVYLPTCNAAELSAVFGSVISYVVEDENPAAFLHFRAVDGKLVR